MDSSRGFLWDLARKNDISRQSLNSRQPTSVTRDGSASPLLVSSQSKKRGHMLPGYFVRSASNSNIKRQANPSGDNSPIPSELLVKRGYSKGEFFDLTSSQSRNWLTGRDTHGATHIMTPKFIQLNKNSSIAKDILASQSSLRSIWKQASLQSKTKEPGCQSDPEQTILASLSPKQSTSQKISLVNEIQRGQSNEARRSIELKQNYIMKIHFTPQPSNQTEAQMQLRGITLKHKVTQQKDKSREATPTNPSNSSLSSYQRTQQQICSPERHPTIKLSQLQRKNTSEDPSVVPLYRNQEATKELRKMLKSPTQGILRKYRRHMTEAPERATNVSVLSPSTIISEITPTVEGSQRREFLSAQEVKERMKTQSSIVMTDLEKSDVSPSITAGIKFANVIARTRDKFMLGKLSELLKQKQKAVKRPISKIFLKKKQSYSAGQRRRFQLLAKLLLSFLHRLNRCQVSILDLMTTKVFPRIPFQRHGSVAFFYAVRKNEVEIVKNILNKCRFFIFDFDSKNQTCLHKAAKLGYEEMLQHLLSLGAEVDQLDIAGRTPLYYAERFGTEKCVEILVNHSEDFDQARRPINQSFSQAIAIK